MEATDAPRLDRCKPSCANIARTDHHAAGILAHAEALQKQAASEALPGPLADRLARHAGQLREPADRHEHDRIRAAMGRILSNKPEHSNSALTIIALAAEAQVPRNALTQRHTDLGYDVYEMVRARGQTPDNERRLRQQVRRLKELRAADAEEVAQLKADVEALVGALHQATMANSHLRRQLADLHGTVRALPTQAPLAR
ncbi:hypothetical protein ACIP2Y_06385 [Streptomyces sviceus]|uniref:hypothetical protein n=1 Tax=Streptomyces sviceus TaxID=285530 RepID=UPI00381C5B40